MSSLGKTILVLVVVSLLAGCTMKFKATDVEFDGQAKSDTMNHTYELVSMSLFDVEAD